MWPKKSRGQNQAVLIPVSTKDNENTTANFLKTYRKRKTALIPINTDEGDNIANLSQQETQPLKRRAISVPNSSVPTRPLGASLVSQCFSRCLGRPCTISPPTPIKQDNVETEIEDNNEKLNKLLASEQTDSGEELHYDSLTDEESMVLPEENVPTECKRNEDNSFKHIENAHLYHMNNLISSPSECVHSERLRDASTFSNFKIKKEIIHIESGDKDGKATQSTLSSTSQTYVREARNENSLSKLVLSDANNAHVSIKTETSEYNGDKYNKIYIPISSQSTSELENITESSVMMNQLFPNAKKSKPNIEEEIFSLNTSMAKYLLLNVDFEKEDVTESIKYLKAKYINLKPSCSENSYPLVTTFQSPAMLNTIHSPKPVVTTSGLELKKVINEARLLLLKRNKRKDREINEKANSCEKI